MIKGGRGGGSRRFGGGLFNRHAIIKKPILVGQPDSTALPLIDKMTKKEIEGTAEKVVGANAPAA